VTKTNAIKTIPWLIIPVLIIGVISFSCQPHATRVPTPLPVSFKLAGQYAIATIQIDPTLREGQDVIAMYADSSGKSPCLSGAIIRFDPTGWVTFSKPAGCEQNDDLTQITGLYYGDRWSIQDDVLLVDHIGQKTRYDLSTTGDQVFLSWDIDKGYASSLVDNTDGYTVTIELKRL
jgi:hypothetical protein